MLWEIEIEMHWRVLTARLITRKHGSHLEIFELSGRLQSEWIKCAKVINMKNGSKSGGCSYSCTCAAVLLSLEEVDLAQPFPYL